MKSNLFQIELARYYVPCTVRTVGLIILCTYEYHTDANIARYPIQYVYCYKNQ